MYTVANVLSDAELSELNAAIASLDFVDGKATAFGRARAVKNNEQAASSPELSKIRLKVLDALQKSYEFRTITQAKLYTQPIISRYGAGKEYGFHVDGAIMDGIRSDISYTLFLKDPKSYEGGELIVHLGASELRIKLPAGTLFCYPSNTLHRVAPVTRNERIAAVGWVQSYVRDAQKRETLLDFVRVRQILIEKKLDGPEMDSLNKGITNLRREWADL